MDIESIIELIDQKLSIPYEIVANHNSMTIFKKIYYAAIDVWKEHDIDGYNIAVSEHVRHFESAECAPNIMMNLPLLRSDTSITHKDGDVYGMHCLKTRLDNYQYSKKKVIEWLVDRLVNR